MIFFLHANSEDIHMYMYLVYGVLQRTLIKKKLWQKEKRKSPHGFSYASDTFTSWVLIIIDKLAFLEIKKIKRPCLRSSNIRMAITYLWNYCKLFLLFLTPPPPELAVYGKQTINYETLRFSKAYYVHVHVLSF